jgi:hypothetical protein
MKLTGQLLYAESRYSEAFGLCIWTNAGMQPNRAIHFPKTASM